MLKDFGHILNKSFSFKQQASLGGQSRNVLILLNHWKDIVGDKLIEISLPQRISNKKILYVVVNHPAYAHHLKSFSVELLEKIHNKFPQFKHSIIDMKFYFSETAFQEVKTINEKKESKEDQRPYDMHPQNPVYKRIYEEAKNKFIESEPEIRESLISIYIQMNWPK